MLLKSYKLKLCFLLGMMFSLQFAFAQSCDNGTNQYPATGVAAPTSGSVQVETCNFAGEFALITNIVANTTYTFTSAVNIGGTADYITLRRVNNNAIIDEGVSPLTTTIGNGISGLEMHINLNDGACGTDVSCHTSNVAVGTVNNTCVAGELSTTGIVTVCSGPAGSFFVAADGTESIPTLGGYAFCFTPTDGTASGGAAGSGGNTATTTGGFCITGAESTGETWDNDLGGILSANLLPVLEGEWTITGDSYSDSTDPITTICSTTTTTLIVNFEPYNVVATSAYNCTTNTATLTVTNASTGTYIAKNGAISQNITSATNYTFTGLATNQTHDIAITNATGDTCDIQQVYPNCRVLGTGCNDLVLEGDFEIIPTAAWVESSTDGSATATGFSIIDDNLELAGVGSAWLGGYVGDTGSGFPYTTTITQNKVLPSGSLVNMYFWGLWGLCDSANDIFTVEVDGTVVMTMNAGNADCGDGAWHEYSADLSAYADGANHAIQLKLVQAGTNGVQTNFFIDEMIIEECSSSCDLPIGTASYDCNTGNVTVNITATGSGNPYSLNLNNSTAPAQTITTTGTYTFTGIAPGTLYTLVADDAMGCSATLWTDNPSCPCIAPTGTATYDCANDLIQLNITNPGTPTGSYNASIDGGTAVNINSVGSYPLSSFTGFTPDQTYNMSFDDGAGCTASIDYIYGDCRTPGSGCSDNFINGDFEGGSGGWSSAAADALNINVYEGTTDPHIKAQFSLGSGTQSAVLGRYGGTGTGTGGAPYTSTVSKSVATTSGNTMMLYFWVFWDACDSTSDQLEVSVDGTVVSSFTGGAFCGDSKWHELSVNIDAFADGTNAVIAFTLTENETNGGLTRVYIDEGMIDNCTPISCPVQYNGIAGTPVDGTDYETDGLIFSIQTIAAGTTIDYDSGTDITLGFVGATFEVQLGATFCAFIDGCNGTGGAINPLGAENISSLQADETDGKEKNEENLQIIQTRSNTLEKNDRVNPKSIKNRALMYENSSEELKHKFVTRTLLD